MALNLSIALENSAPERKSQPFWDSGARRCCSERASGGANYSTRELFSDGVGSELRDALLGVSYGAEYRFGWNLDPNLSSVTITLAGRTIFGANLERRRGRRSATMRSASSRLS